MRSQCVTPLLFALVAALIPACAQAAGREASLTRLDGTRLSEHQVAATVERLMAADHVPGLGLAIVDKGKVVYQRAFGLRDVEHQLPFTDSTIVYAASLTKAMFATVVVQLAHEGVIDLDRPIERMLPRPLASYEKYADLAGDARTGQITARMLLSHTSGLPNWRFYRPGGKLDFVCDPGTRFSYSGEGINLLQFAIEAGLGLSVDSLLQARLFRPDEMRRTSMTWRTDFAEDCALGYDEHGGAIAHQQRGSARAAGSADSDLGDIARFIAGVARGQGMSARARREMLTPQVRIHSRYQFPAERSDTTSRDDRVQLSYGLGWGLLSTPYGPAYFKEGHDDGWGHYTITFERSQKAMVILTNSSRGEGLFRELLASLLGDTFTPWEWEHYTPYDAAAVPGPGTP